METVKADKKALKHNTIALMIIQVLNYVLPFVTLPYVGATYGFGFKGIDEVDKYNPIFVANIPYDILDFLRNKGEYNGTNKCAK